MILSLTSSSPHKSPTILSGFTCPSTICSSTFPIPPPPHTHTRRDEVFEEEEPKQEAESPVTESESDGDDDDDDDDDDDAAEEEAGADRVSSLTGSRYSRTTYFG